MTNVIDRVHGGTVEELPELDRAPVPPSRPALTIERRTGPIHVLLAVVLGCSAVLLMAMLGHLSGWRAALAVVVAWVGCRSRRGLHRPSEALGHRTGPGGQPGRRGRLGEHARPDCGAEVGPVDRRRVGRHLVPGRARTEPGAGAGQAVVTVDPGHHVRASRGRGGGHDRRPARSSGRPRRPHLHRRPPLVRLDLGRSGHQDDGSCAGPELEAVPADPGRERRRSRTRPSPTCPLARPIRPSSTRS